MSYEIKADRSQTFLFPVAIDDWIPQNHPARFIAAFIETLDLQANGFPVGHAPTGRPGFSAELMLSVICYCYFSRIRSLRGMEQACLDNIGVIWLTGNERPDFNTIGLFFRKNRKAIRNLLKQSVKVAASANLIGMVLHAVDGTKIRAQASRRSGIFKKSLTEALEKVDASILEMEACIEAEAKSDSNSLCLPKKLANAEARKNSIEAGLAELKQANRENLNPSEPDADVMQCDGKFDFGYNAQAVTDAKAGIIVAVDVVENGNDRGLLALMLDKVKESVGAVAKTTVADTGYSAGKDLADAEEKGYKVLANISQHVIPDGDKCPFHIARFKYDSEKKTCICPLNKKLVLVSVRKGRESDGMLTSFRCDDFLDCPKRWQCSSNKRGRGVEYSEYRKHAEEQKLKQQTPEAKAALDRRASIVEPTFAYAKEGLSFRKWSFRTLDGVQAQWALMATTMNLRKLYRHWANGVVKFA